ncbi:MAG: hypothetical protein IIW40_01610, partial [Clostridia bacterium]|nr:hypothetical protein [Clostridia bacterium]
MAQDVVVNGTTYPAVEAVALTGVGGNTQVYYPDAVRYVPQTLTAEQKAQARGNIGIDTYLAEELAKRAQLRPEPAESLEWLKTNGDTGKIYVLPDGYLYMWLPTVTEGETVPNFTNLMDQPGAYIKDGYRYSHSSAAFKECSTDCAIVVPISSTAGAFTLRVKEATLDGAAYMTSAYFGTNNQTFSGSNDNTKFEYADDNNGTVTFTQKSYSGGYNYFVVHVAAGVDAENLIVTRNEPITYTTTEGGTEYAWRNTGRNLTPADYEDRIIEAEAKLDDHADRLDNLERSQTTGLSLEHNSCSIFRKVVCCGDSFTAGYIGTTNDNIVQTNWEYAWPSFMARLTGNEYVNCGHSGK